MYKRQPQKIVVLLLLFCLSLSPMRYTSERVCVQIRTTTPLFIHMCQFDFCTRQIGPNKLSGPTSPRNTKKWYFILFIRALKT